MNGSYYVDLSPCIRESLILRNAHVQQAWASIIRCICIMQFALHLGHKIVDAVNVLEL